MTTQAKKYFENHPAVDHFYFTSDGCAFFREQDAEAHAYGKNLAVKKFTRAEYEALESGDENKIELATKVAQMNAGKEYQLAEAERQKATKGALADFEKALQQTPSKKKF